MPDGGLREPYAEEGLYCFELPQTASDCKSVTPGDAIAGREFAPKEIITKPHVSWGHVSARQLGWGSVDSGGENMHLVDYVGAVLEQCDIFRAFGEAPHAPIAGMPTELFPEAK